MTRNRRISQFQNCGFNCLTYCWRFVYCWWCSKIIMLYAICLTLSLCSDHFKQSSFNSFDTEINKKGNLQKQKKNIIISNGVPFIGRIENIRFDCFGIEVLVSGDKCRKINDKNNWSRRRRRIISCIDLKDTDSYENIEDPHLAFEN